jgi:hypothetical protein
MEGLNFGGYNFSGFDTLSDEICQYVKINGWINLRFAFSVDGHRLTTGGVEIELLPICSSFNKLYPLSIFEIHPLMAHF